MDMMPTAFYHNTGMAHIAEDDWESLQDHYFKQKQKSRGAGGFLRFQGFGSLTRDRRPPAHHSRSTDSSGENFVKVYNYNHNTIPKRRYPADNVYNAKQIWYNANEVQFNEDRKRHASPSYSRWNRRSPAKRHKENKNKHEYSQSARREVVADPPELNGQRQYITGWEGKGSSSKRNKEMSKAHEFDKSTDTDKRKWDKSSPSQRLVGTSNHLDQSAEIKRRKMDKSPKDHWDDFCHSKRNIDLSKKMQKVIENTQQYDHHVDYEKSCRLVTEFEGLAKENVVAKRTDSKDDSNSNSQQKDQIENSAAGILESKPHDPLKATGKRVSNCEKFENNTIPVENSKTLTGTQDSKNKQSSTVLPDFTFGMHKAIVHHVLKNKETESCSQIEKQSSICAKKGKIKLMLSKDEQKFSHANNMKTLTAADAKIAHLDAGTFPEKSSNVLNHKRMDRDCHPKKNNEYLNKASVILPNYEKCRCPKKDSKKDKVNLVSPNNNEENVQTSIVKLGQSELSGRDKLNEQNLFGKEGKESCFEFIAAKRVERRKSDETFNRSKHNTLNNKAFMSNVKSKESKTTDNIVNNNQGNLFDSFDYFTLPFKSSERSHCDLSNEEEKKNLHVHYDDHRKFEADIGNVARSTTMGHSQEKPSCAKMGGNETNFICSGDQTNNCVENTVDKRKTESSSTKSGTDENNEAEHNEQHPKCERGAEGNITAYRSITNHGAFHLYKHRRRKHKKLKIGHKHLKHHTSESKKLKSAKQALIMSSKNCKKVNIPSEIEVTNEKNRDSYTCKKFHVENKKKINPTKKIRPSDISGSDKENVDVKRVKRVNNVQSTGQDRHIEECIEPVIKENFDEENLTLIKEIKLQPESKTLKVVHTEELKQNRNLKVDDAENEEEEEDYTIIDLNVAPATPYPMTESVTDRLWTESVAPMQEYKDCGMDKEKASGLTLVCNIQTPASEIKGHSARFLQFLYNPDTSDISDEDIGKQNLIKGESDMNIDHSNSSTQSSHKDKNKEELVEDAVKPKFKRQQPNKEERRMRMERLEEAYMQLATDSTNSKEKERSVSKKRKPKDKAQHHKSKHNPKSVIDGKHGLADKTLDKGKSKKSKKSKNKTLSADKGRCVRNGELAKTPDETKSSNESTSKTLATGIIERMSHFQADLGKLSMDQENLHEDGQEKPDSLMSSQPQSVDTSKGENCATEVVMANNLINQEAGEMQQRKDEGSLDTMYKEDSSKNLRDFILQHCINTSEKVVNGMENVANSETGVESSHPRLSPKKAAVSDLEAAQDYLDKSGNVAKPITAAERSDALAHHQIWQNGFEFIHDLILMDGRRITTKGHIEPKLLNMKEKNIIRCQVCEKYMTPRSFMYHHDNSDIIKQIDIKRSVSNPPKPDPEDIVIWNSGAGDIWEYFLKEISIVDQFGKDRHTAGRSCGKESLEDTGLCSGSSTKTMMVGENVHLPSGDDQRPVSKGNTAGNLQISSLYALGFIGTPATTLRSSSGFANSYQIMSESAQEKRLTYTSENSLPCKAAAITSQLSLTNLDKTPLAKRSDSSMHHVSGNNFSFTSRPDVSVGIVQDVYDCNLQGHIYLQPARIVEQMKHGSSVTSIRHGQGQNQMRREELQANIFTLLGSSTNKSFNSGTSASDGRGEFRNSHTRQLGEKVVAACSVNQQFHGEAYTQQVISDTPACGQHATEHDLVASQARNSKLVADNQILRVAVSSNNYHPRSIPSLIETTIYSAPSPDEMIVYNASSALLDDRSADQNGEADPSSKGPLKVSSQPLGSFETYIIPSTSSSDTRSHLSTCFMHTQNELASNTTMNDSETPTAHTAIACRNNFGNRMASTSQQDKNPIHSSNQLYRNPTGTNNLLTVTSASNSVVGNQSLPMRNTLSSLDDEKSELQSVANKQLSGSFTSKENALSVGFSTGYETSRDQIGSSESQGTLFVGKLSTNQNFSEITNSGNVNTKKPELKAGPSNPPVTAAKSFSQIFGAFDKLIDEIDFHTVPDLDPLMMLAKKLEIKCMHEMSARSKRNQALCEELMSKLQGLQHTNDNGKT